MNNIHDEAADRWHDILPKLPQLTDLQRAGKHGPCPVCGGTDRFRIVTESGKAGSFCGDTARGGVDTVMYVLGCDFADAAKWIRQQMGTEITPPPKTGMTQKQLRWLEKRIGPANDHVADYLTARGLSLPPSIGVIEQCDYYQSGESIGKFDAMACRFIGPDNTGCGIHLTYLDDGKKASLTPARKMKKGSDKPIVGGAVRLYPLRGPVLGIAEGIETAIAASMLYNVPVWATTTTSLMKSFQVPDLPQIKRVMVFADRDKNYAGQSAAYQLGERLAKTLPVRVIQPAHAGDFNDELLSGVDQ